MNRSSRVMPFSTRLPKAARSSSRSLTRESTASLLLALRKSLVLSFKSWLVKYRTKWNWLLINRCPMSSIKGLIKWLRARFSSRSKKGLTAKSKSSLRLCNKQSKLFRMRPSNSPRTGLLTFRAQVSPCSCLMTTKRSPLIKSKLSRFRNNLKLQSQEHREEAPILERINRLLHQIHQEVIKRGRVARWTQSNNYPKFKIRSKIQINYKTRSSNLR